MVHPFPREQLPLSFVNLGQIIPMDTQVGCQASGYAHFYRSPLDHLPVELPNCDDNVSMMELSGGLRIFYIFRPAAFRGMIPEICQGLGLNTSEVDVVVTNELTDIGPFLKLLDSKVPLIEFSHVLPFFFDVQGRGCGWIDGGVNVGIDNPPDDHPCMPGIPDDEANVLLFALTHRLIKIITT